MCPLLYSELSDALVTFTCIMSYRKIIFIDVVNFSTASKGYMYVTMCMYNVYINKTAMLILSYFSSCYMLH